MKLDTVDVMNVMNGVHLDRRLMPTYAVKKITPGFLSFLKPGTGFGGSCFSKDLHAITSFGKKNMCEMMILNSVLKLIRINLQ